MTFPDQSEIKRIAAESAKSGYRLRNLILDVATRETFNKQ